MRLHGILVALVVLTSSTSLLFAGPGPGPGRGKGKGKPGPGGKGKPSPEMVLKHLDKDGNGSISKSEAPERMASHFDKLDANGDGAVTLDELKAAFKKRGERGERGGRGPGGKGFGGKGRPTPEDFIKRFDKDGNGTVSRGELPEKMQQKFDKIDQNSDGAIDVNEVKALFAKHAAKGGKGPHRQKPDGQKPAK